jgi:hypothetical protein
MDQGTYKLCEMGRSAGGIQKNLGNLEVIITVKQGAVEKIAVWIFF